MMRLLHCVEDDGGCGDILLLGASERGCRCGKSVGRINMDARAMVRGPCRTLAMQEREVWTGETGTWVVSGRTEHTDGRARWRPPAPAPVTFPTPPVPRPVHVAWTVLFVAVLLVSLCVGIVWMLGKFRA